MVDSHVKQVCSVSLCPLVYRAELAETRQKKTHTLGDYSQEPLSYCRLKCRCLKPYLIHPLNRFYATEFKRRKDITCWEQNVQHLSSMKILQKNRMAI